MSSTFSPMTGMREWPLRTASDVAAAADLSLSIQIISVRGTITSRAGVSPSSNTDWIIRPLVGGDHTALLRQVDDFTQLDLRGERPVAEAATGRQHVSEHHQHSADRGQQYRNQLQR